MKKLLLSLAVAAIGFSSNAQDPAYTIQYGPDYNSKGVSAYTSNTKFTVANAGITFEMVAFNNNNNGWEFVRCGSKSAASTATITNLQSIPEAINKVVISAKKNKSGAADIAK